MTSLSQASDAVPQCPTPGEKCKVLFLNENEENLLVGRNGILDTAAQARNLDLGQFAVYFKTKIGSAPEGTVKETEKPKTEGNPDLGAGPMKPASKK